jgi:hypothetical protein
VFNQADTAAEASQTGVGLCAALAGACAKILRDGGKDIRAGWDYWNEHAKMGLLYASGEGRLAERELKVRMAGS